MSAKVASAIIGAALLALAHPCLAQINATKDELVRQWGPCQPNPMGKPRGPNVYDSVLDVGDDCIFAHKGFFIRAYFKARKAVMLDYRKYPSLGDTIFMGARPGADSQISDPEIYAILESAVPSTLWIPISSNSPIRQWRTNDSSAFAYYFATGSHNLYTLQIQTAAVDAMYKKVDKYIRGLRPN
jgi:hypothetical protein